MQTAVSLSVIKMKQLVFFLFLVTIHIAASIEDDDFKDPNSCTEQEGPIGCSADCSSRQICLNGIKTDVVCPSKLGKASYCNEATHECDQKEKCNNNDGNFVCPGKGTFPHLLNCHKLYMCKQKGDPGVLKTCGTIKKYNPATGTCASGLSLCYNFSPLFGLCFAKKNQIVVHPLNNKYFVYCNNDNPVLGTCLAGHIYNTDTLKCEYKCTKSGLYIDEANKSCYYKCTWSLFKYKHEWKCCDPGDVFNEKLKMCGPEVVRKVPIP